MPAFPRRRARAAALLSAALLAAPGAWAQSRVTLPGHVSPRIQRSALIGRAPADEAVKLSLVVRVDQSLMDRTLAGLYGPNAPKKKHFLTSAEFAQTFDLAAKRQALKDFARAAGLTVDESKDHPSSLIVHVSGPANQVEKVFGVHLNHYRSPDGQVFRANDSDPSIPASLAPHLHAVLGLSNFYGGRKPHLLRHNPVLARSGSSASGAASPRLTGTGTDGGLAPADIKTIYGLSTTTLTGAGQTAAVYELDSYSQSDITLYEQSEFPTPYPNTTVTCTSQDSTCGVSQNDDGAAEVALDIEMVIALSSGAADILVYTAENADPDDVDAYADIASDDKAQVISTSWGLYEAGEGASDMTSEAEAFEQMAVQGQSIFAAAGDDGAYDAGDGIKTADLATDDPASQPYVTGVGGTSLTGTTIATSTESVWNDGCLNSAGTEYVSCSSRQATSYEAGGGGVANYDDTYWPTPSYQVGVSSAFSTQYRNVPDVSLNADPNSAPYTVCVGGSCDNLYGGTSVATPLWAALTALVNQQRSQLGEGPLGFANPSIYQLATSASYSNLFNDITSGNNGYYDAQTGYDDASGWGSFKGRGAALISALSGPSVPAFASPQFTSVSSAAITYNWLNAAEVSGTSYTAEIAASSGFSSVLASSTTFNPYASFGAGGAGSALTPATTYYFRVEAAYDSVDSSFSTTTVADTLAAAPTSFALVSVSSIAISVSWAAGGNPGGTDYLAQLWTQGGSTTTLSLTSDATTFSGLSPSTTYYLQVQAENPAGVLSSSEEFLQETLPATPGAPSGVALGVSSVSWSWGSVSGATAYLVYPASNTAVALTTTTAASFSETGLSTNTAYGLVIAAQNAGGNSLLSPSATVYTLAATPASFALMTVSSAALSVSWNADGNPNGTEYLASIWTQGGSTTTLTLTADATTFSGLSPSTTYFLQVQAENAADFATSAAQLSQETLPATPGAPSGVALGVSSVSWSWGSVSGATAYLVYPASNTAVALTTTTAASFNEIGLSTNTEYGLAIAAQNAGGNSLLSPSATVYTLAATPANFELTLVSTVAISVSWNEADNPNGTEYLASIWTQGGSTATLTLTADATTFSGLGPLTTYFLQVQAENGNDVPTATAQLSTETPPAPPATPGTPAGTALGVSSISWSWSSVSGATSYVVYPASNTTVALETTTINSFLELNLTTDTAYGLEVAAMNSAGSSGLSAPAAAYTLAAAPTSFALVSVGYSSVTLQWAADNNPGGVEYQAQLWAATGATTTLTLTGLTTTFAGLSPLTTYFAQVGALNTSNVLSPGGVILTTTTPINPPTAAPGGFAAAAMGISSISWSWNAVSSATAYDFYPSTGGPPIQVLTTNFAQTGLNVATAYGAAIAAINGSGQGPLASTVTTYTLAAPPTSFALVSVGYSSVTLQWAANNNPGGVEYQAQLWATTGATTTLTLTGLTTTFAGLSPLTTYYTQVGALNASNVLSPGGVILTTMTPINLPIAAPGGLAAAALGISSISWAWNAVSSATAYDFYPSTGGPPVQVSATNFIQAGLNLDTAYGASVAAINGSGQGPLASTVTTYTLAAPPTSFALVSVGYSSVTLQWAANNNPGGVEYQAQLWAATGATTTLTLTSLTTTFAGLSPLATYYAQVGALNGLGVLTPGGVVLSTETLPTPLAAAPAGLAAAALGISSVGWTWNSLPGATAYDVYIATTDGVSLQAVSTATAYAFTSLAPDQPAIAYVAGGNASGAGPLTLGVTVYSLAAPPAGSAVSPVFITSAAAQWQTGDFAGTRYNVEYGSLGGSTATVIASSTETVLTGLQAQTTYFLYIEALNGAGLASASGGELDFVTLPPLGAQGVSTSSGAVIYFDAPKGPVVITIPAGAFASAVAVSVTAPDAFPSAASVAALTGTGVGIQITLDQPVQPQVPCTISLSYANTPFTAYDPDTLLIARYDPTDNVWVPLPSTPYPAQQLVTAVTNHFSLFQIMASAAAGSLSSPKVFPNPMRPALGETTITFADLPARTTLKIYDILGERVRELQADASGIAVWDGRNSGGNAVASGVYFVLASSGSSRAILKVAIQR